MLSLGILLLYLSQNQRIKSPNIMLKNKCFYTNTHTYTHEREREHYEEILHAIIKKYLSFPKSFQVLNIRTINIQ